MFNGPEYDAKRDGDRLWVQHRRIFALMRDGIWRTLQEIADHTGDPTPSVSAQLRHLRKKRFGAHTVERQHVGRGLYEYRLILNQEAVA